MALPALAAGVGSVIGGLFGKSEAQKDREQQMALIQQSIKDLEAIGIPSIDAQRLVMEDYRSQGNLTPELEEAFKLGDSAAGGISTDAKYKEAGISALDKLAEVGSSGGLTLNDRARLEGIQSDVNQQARGREGAIMQDMGARGQMGSGMELLARMQSSQDATSRLHDEGMNTAGRAEQRALDAMVQRGELGSKLRGQDFDEQERVAAAKDKIAAWNAANTQDVRTRNTGAVNSAREYNLGNSQKIADQNVGLHNETESYNKGLYGKDYQNRLDKAKATATARAGGAQAYGDRADATAGMWGKIGQGAGQVVGGAMRSTMGPTSEPKRDDSMWAGDNMKSYDDEEKKSYA